MDCCRSSRRTRRRRCWGDRALGFEEMESLALGKTRRDPREDIPILNYLVPKEFKHKDGQLYGMTFEKVAAEYDAHAAVAGWWPTGEAGPVFRMRRRAGRHRSGKRLSLDRTRQYWLEFDEWGHASESTGRPFRSTHPKVFFAGDAAFGPKNIIWAVAQCGHQAAISIHKMCNGEDICERPAPGVTVTSTKMGIHEWSYDNDISARFAFRWSRIATRRSRCKR